MNTIAKSTPKLFALLIAVALPSLASAHCPQEATAGAPHIPEIGEVSYEEVKALGAEVKRYLSRAGLALSQCEPRDDTFLYNAAVAELEDVAERYNRLTDAYNRSIATRD
ncbi:hypothetical protein NCG89_09560 [Spongiibacter taiwanensis]|uniref:hypothetical protein n=1 Tax=Spongiibacter taiwanensis TaxID=1748242 RepID=UPI002035D399|nr:hypothetical protein [Spongiibacter taiwanensis]USA41763.1 hypothetical protein NCG89_09560 [Spongiibacter taiwanensis]